MVERGDHGGEGEARRRYRPAARGLLFGLAATGLRLGAIGAFVLVFLTRDAGVVPDVTRMTVVLIGLDYTALACALAGVSYSAIAWHRGERGAQVWFAWVFSVVGVVGGVELMPYVIAG